MDILTPAEELGLSGLSLDSRVRRALYAVPPARAHQLLDELALESYRRQLIYERAGVFETIRLMARPIAVMPDQLAYIHFVTLTLLNALKRLPELYLADPAIRAIVPLTPEEERWLGDSWGPSQREFNPVFGRLDATCEFTSPMWKETLRFLEPNLTGVGGIHLAPTCDRLLADLVVPLLRERDAELDLEVGPDLRELFIQEVLDHLEAIGRPGRNLCFIEPKYAVEGICEQEPLARYFHERHGMTVVHADPRELFLRDGEVWFEETRVDIAYRDYEVRDLIALETEEGIDLAPIRQLFRENRMISSVAGDFDHKSCWEILTDPVFAQRYFSAEERQVFRRHVLWTRVLSERQTMLPDGTIGDLIEFARKEQDLLVLKPNRGYGGDGVLIGHLLEAAQWEGAMETAITGPNQWVIQRLASIPVYEFPVAGPADGVHVEPFYTVLGFAPTKFGVAILGRASQKQVVNVAQRGGMCGILIGRPPGRLLGPGRMPQPS